MMPKHLHQCVEEKAPEVQEPLQRVDGDKTIALVQVCLRCGRKFQFKRGRKGCPKCQGLLRSTAMVIKAPCLSQTKNI